MTSKRFIERNDALAARLPSFVIGLLAHYPRSLAAVAFLGLASSLLEGFGIGLVIPLVGLLLAETLPATTPYPLSMVVEFSHGVGRDARILLIGLAVVGLICGKGLVQGANHAFIATLHGRVVKDLRVALGRKVLELDYGFYLENEKTHIAPILMSDSWYTSETIRFVLTLIPAVMTIGVFALILLLVSPSLGLIALFSAFAVQVCLIAVERRQRRLSATVNPLDHEHGERTLEIVNAMRVIRVFGRETSEAERYAANADSLRLSVARIERVSALVNPLSDVLIAGTFVMILIVSIPLGISLPVATAFLLLLSRAQPYAQAIGRARVQIAAYSAAVGQVRWLLSQPSSTPGAKTGAAVASIDQPITFDRVGFTYPDGTPGLADATFTIRPGVATAVLGKSGMGKTTLVNLLSRLISPTSGLIRHGDHDLSTFSLRDWRSRVAIAGQDMELLDGTIADNVAYGKDGATREEIEEAIRAAGAAPFVAELPDGMETHVGYSALNLSGGQRQRISLARALVRRPDLLILDEATNAVDGMAEAEIIDLLAQHRFFLTALFISHRRSVLAACQDGIVFDHGRVIEWGPIESLTYYRNMS